MTAPMDTGGTTASITIVNLAEMYTIAATILYINAIATLSIYWRTKARSDRFHLPPTTAEMIALSFIKKIISVTTSTKDFTSRRSLPTHLKPSLKLEVTESPTMLVSTLNRLTISPAPLSANSGSCFSVDK
jgi:hypothetical protein